MGYWCEKDEKWKPFGTSPVSNAYWGYMTKYTLELLSEEFGRHKEEYEKTEHYKSTDFNLPLALKTIVDEIRELKVSKQNDILSKLVMSTYGNVKDDNKA